jgi:dTDP-glucose 4,6-dehydratase
MTVLITGGNGFVMSNFARHWIDSHPDEKVVILDAAAPDQMAQNFFASIAHKIRWVQASILEPEIWNRQIDRNEITHIVHGATLTTCK